MITGQTVKNTYQGDGVNREFTITFEFTDSSQVKFKVNGEEVTTNFALNTVAKTLTYPTVASELDPLTSADEIEIYRDTEITQDIEFNNGGPLNADMIEKALDKLTMIAQELRAREESDSEDGVKILADGTDIDTLKADGLYFIKGVTSTKGLPCSNMGNSSTPFALVRVTNVPIEKGTYFVCQEMVLWEMYVGVDAISEPIVFVRNLTDYTYTQGFQDWKALGNEIVTKKVTGTEITLSDLSYRGCQIIANPTSNYSPVPNTAITSLEISNYFSVLAGKTRIIFKAGSGFSLTVSGKDYWIGEKPTSWTEGQIYAITLEGCFLSCEEVTM